MVRGQLDLYSARGGLYSSIDGRLVDSSSTLKPHYLVFTHQVRGIGAGRRPYGSALRYGKDPLAGHRRAVCRGPPDERRQATPQESGPIIGNRNLSWKPSCQAPLQSQKDLWFHCEARTEVSSARKYAYRPIVSLCACPSFSSHILDTLDSLVTVPVRPRFRIDEPLTPVLAYSRSGTIDPLLS